MLPRSESCGGRRGLGGGERKGRFLASWGILVAVRASFPRDSLRVRSGHLRIHLGATTGRGWHNGNPAQLQGGGCCLLGWGLAEAVCFQPTRAAAGVRARAGTSAADSSHDATRRGGTPTGISMLRPGRPLRQCVLFLTRLPRGGAKIENRNSHAPSLSSSPSRSPSPLIPLARAYGCFYGYFWVLEAHQGGRRFRTHCPNCRQSRAHVSTAAPRPRGFFLKGVGAKVRSDRSPDPPWAVK